MLVIPWRYYWLASIFKYTCAFHFHFPSNLVVDVPDTAKAEDVNKVIFYPIIIVMPQSKLFLPIPNWYTHTKKEYTGIIYIWTTDRQVTEGKKGFFAVSKINFTGRNSDWRSTRESLGVYACHSSNRNASLLLSK